MKIYEEPKAPYLMRINIKRHPDKTEHLTLCEVTQQECYDFIKNLIEKQNLSIFQTGKLTNIEIREGFGSENGKSISMSFKGLSPKEVKELIITKLNSYENI
jgi:hypothetical protein